MSSSSSIFYYPYQERISLQQAIAVLDADQLPAAKEDCDYCRYYAKRVEEERNI